MRRLNRAAALASTAVLLAACSGGGSSTAASASCNESTAATVVSATVGGNAWAPVSAKANEVITWTNADSAPHRVELDDGSCSMAGNIAGGGTRSLVFTRTGTFPFHCGVHASMKGTITIS